MVGGSGTGKTHLATALGVAACQQGKRVRFIGATELVNRLLEAHAQNRVNQVLSGFQKLELVVLDELGFVPFAPTGAELLFEFFAEARFQHDLGLRQVGEVVGVDVRADLGAVAARGACGARPRSWRPT